MSLKKSALDTKIFGNQMIQRASQHQSPVNSLVPGIGRENQFNLLDSEHGNFLHNDCWTEVLIVTYTTVKLVSNFPLKLPVKAPMLNNKRITGNQILPIQLKNRLRNKNTAHQSRGRKVQVLKVTQLCPTLWTVACQAPLSMEFSRQKYWSE